MNEMVYDMDIDFECPEAINIEGEIQDVINYSLIEEQWWFDDDGVFCVTCEIPFPEGTYAMLTKSVALIPCVACGTFSRYYHGELIP